MTIDARIVTLMLSLRHLTPEDITKLELADLKAFEKLFETNLSLVKEEIKKREK